MNKYFLILLYETQVARTQSKFGIKHLFLFQQEAMKVKFRATYTNFLE